MKHSLFSIIGILFWVVKLQSQPFFPVGGGTNQPVESFYTDMVNNYLLVGGQFSMAGGSTPCHGLIKWDGTMWESWSSNLGYSDPQSIVKFNNELYLAGAFSYFDSTLNNWKNYFFVKWNYSNYQLEIIDTNINGFTRALATFNGEIIIAGNFKIAGGVYSPKIARYDGQQFHAMPLLDTVGGGYAINTLIEYNGELYAGGNFLGPAGQNMKNIARFNGSQWLPLGQGLSVGAWVNDFTIYQDKLIVAGYFHSNWGDPGNGIAAWDGVSWSQVGTNLISNWTRSLIVYNGELYAGQGDIGFGTVTLIKLDTVSNSWVVPSGNVPYGAINTMTVFGNDLYIGGGLIDASGDTSKRNIFRYNPLTGFQSIDTPQSSFQITPNPATETITLQYPVTKTTGHATVYNVLGEAVQQLTLLPGTTRHQLNIATLPAGLYLIKVEADGKSGVKRFVKK